MSQPFRVVAIKKAEIYYAGPSGRNIWHYVRQKLLGAGFVLDNEKLPITSTYDPDKSCHLYFQDILDTVPFQADEADEPIIVE